MMARKSYILFLIALLPFLMYGCGGSKKSEDTAARKAPAARHAPAAQAQAAPENAAGASEPVVDAKHRNPFMSYIVLSRSSKESKKIRGPLERYQISLFRIVAVVVGKDDDSYALVQAPDNKMYIVRKGDAMGMKDGHIVRIDSRGITVREVEKDFSGKVVSTSDALVALPAEKVSK